MKGITVESQRLSRKEVAELLCLSPITISGYIRKGKLKAYRKSDNKLYFLRDEVENFKARTEAITEVAPKDIPDKTPISGSEIGLTAVRGKLLTIKEVAAFLRTSERWIQQRMANGTFPVRWFCIGLRDRVVDSYDLNTYLSKIFVMPGETTLPLKAVRKLRREKEASMKRI